MIDAEKYGVSFSAKQCRNFGVDPQETLRWLLDQGWRRFRLMSYWDLHELQPGHYDFAELDWQIEMITQACGVIALCLGAKQPRWPEYHWPNWAWEAPKPVRDAALIANVEHVVDRYKHNDRIVSWQLENEALLQGFGSRIEIDRARLGAEFTLIKQLDPDRPIAMNTSNGWGVPLRAPLPNRVGFSFYPIMHQNGAYHRTIQKWWLHRVRRAIIEIGLGKPVFVHELQCEPWGPEPIWKMSSDEQAKSMSPAQIQANITAARKIGASPIDLWGAEWWYWRHAHGDDTIWGAVEKSISS